MIERHYDEEALVTMLDVAAPTPDPHLENCGECAGKLDSFHLVTGALRDAATWDTKAVDERPNLDTIATLRAFATNMAAEDSAADAYLADLLAGSRETWKAKLAGHPEYRTAGVVRKLIGATNHALDTMPADAVAITALATEIAEHLDPAAHRADTLARLRGAAWRERAYALYYTGNLAEAERAVSASARHFAACTLPEYETARLGVVRALVFQSLERHREASEAARFGAHTFATFEDTSRLASAQLAEVHSLFQRSDFSGAFGILSKLERRLRANGDAETHARVLGNLAYCCWKLDRIDAALQYHEAAASLLDTLGIHTESVRTRWNIASILAGAGRTDEALAKFDSVHAEFRRLGMASVATQVKLEAAELLLARGRYAEVEEICRAAMQEFAATGLAHTQRALTAIALVKEAAANRTATPTLARSAREYIRRLPEEPNLLFLPPPPA